MHYNWDPILIINLILCIVIFILGISRAKNRVALFAGIAFGLFGVSHVLSILGLSHQLETLTIIIRFLAYLLVILGITSHKN
ncbi:MAG: hypothetical protein JW784_03485 [Candidatus Cloacimonetes bacterium]|nr:hypothetical protein [Candidatus Cloacimonadota bacterium]